MKLMAGPLDLLLQAVSGDLEPGPGGARLLLTALLARPSTSHQGHRPCLVFSASAHASTPCNLASPRNHTFPVALSPRWSVTSGHLDVPLP